MSLDPPLDGTHKGRWPNRLQPHAKVGGYQDVLPALEDATYAALVESIRRRGVLVPIIIDQLGRIIDGHNRFRAAAEVGVECPSVVVQVVNHQDGRDVALLVNTVRRHMGVDQRREEVAALRAAGHSLRAIAGAVGTSQTTVRNDLEVEGVQGCTPERTKGQDGKSYPARRPEPVPASTPPAPPAPVAAPAPETCSTCGVDATSGLPIRSGRCVDCWAEDEVAAEFSQPPTSPAPSPVPLPVETEREPFSQDAAAEAITPEQAEDDEEMQRLKLRAAVASSLKRTLGMFAEFTPELVASSIDGDEWDDWQRRRRGIDDWFDRLDALRPKPGLRLMGGGR